MNATSKSSSIIGIPDLVSDLESITIYDADDYDHDTIKLKQSIEKQAVESPTSANPFVEVFDLIDKLPDPVHISNSKPIEKKHIRSSVPQDRYFLLHDVCGADVKGVILNNSSSYSQSRSNAVCDKLQRLSRTHETSYSQLQPENKMKSSVSFLGKVSGFFKKKPSSKHEEEDNHLFSSCPTNSTRNGSSKLFKNTSIISNGIKLQSPPTHTIKNTIESLSNSAAEDHFTSSKYLKKKALWGHFLIVKSTMISSSRYHLFHELYNCELTNFKCCVDLKVFIEDARNEFFSQNHSLSKDAVCMKSLVPKTEFSIYDLQDLQLNYEDVMSVSSSVLMELVSILVGFITNSNVEDIKDENQRPLITLKLLSAFDKIEPVMLRYVLLLDRANITARRTLENCILFKEFSYTQLGPDAPKLLFEILSRPLITLSKYLNIINGIVKETHPSCPDYSRLLLLEVKIRDLLSSVNKSYSIN